MTSHLTLLLPHDLFYCTQSFIHRQQAWILSNSQVQRIEIQNIYISRKSGLGGLILAAGSPDAHCKFYPHLISQLLSHAGIEKKSALLRVGCNML